VTSCTDSAQALSLFSTDTAAFDLVITDMAMPGLTGCQLVERIRLAEPTLPVILCSGHLESVSKEKIESLAINSVLAKPVSLKGMATAIRQTLDAR
jgi:CheY-like chemotaxis protein